MKYIILLITFFTFQAQANWAPFAKVDQVRYTTKKRCEAKETETCFDFTGKDKSYVSVQSVTQDDLSKPIYKAAYNVQVCDNDDDCRVKMEATTCESGDTVQTVPNTLVPGFKVQCTGITGYEQKTIETLVVNESLKAQFESEKAAAKSLADSIAKKKADINFGKEVTVLFSLKADQKNLSVADRVAFANDFETVSRLLNAGSIETAKSVIEGITPDGTKITTQDKTDILNKINQYLGGN